MKKANMVKIGNNKMDGFQYFGKKNMAALVNWLWADFAILVNWDLGFFVFLSFLLT